jgi:hypothetical protein
MKSPSRTDDNGGNDCGLVRRNDCGGKSLSRIHVDLRPAPSTQILFRQTSASWESHLGVQTEQSCTSGASIDSCTMVQVFEFDAINHPNPTNTDPSIAGCQRHATMTGSAVEKLFQGGNLGRGVGQRTTEMFGVPFSNFEPTTPIFECTKAIYPF